MKFFIDTANINEITEAQKMGVLDGVTTNPTLIARENITSKQGVLERYQKICDIVDGDVSAEVLDTSSKGMIKEGEELAGLSDKIVVKVPMTRDGIKAIKYFSDKGIKTNCTLVFSTNQAILAAKAGATYVSPFLGRLDDIASDGLLLVEEMRQIYDNYSFATEILGASIRHSLHISECAKIGVDVVTVPFSVITKLFEHPLTEKGLNIFIADGKKTQDS